MIFTWWKAFVIGIVIGSLLTIFAYMYWRQKHKKGGNENEKHHIGHMDHITYVNEALRLSDERQASHGNQAGDEKRKE